MSLSESANQTTNEQRLPKHYDHVYTFILTWEDIDRNNHPEIESEIRELRSVLEDKYNFPEPKVYRLPLRNTSRYLNETLRKWENKDGEKTLIIIYYTGHSRLSCDTKFELSAWNSTSRRKLESPVISWDIIHHRLTVMKADILVLLDSCDSAAVVLSAVKEPLVKKMEFIVGSGYPDTTTGFAKNLTKVLKSLVYDYEEFSVVQLYQALVERNVRHNTKMECVDKNTVTTPIYIPFNKGDIGSITLKRLDLVSFDNKDPRHMPPEYVLQKMWQDDFSRMFAEYMAIKSFSLPAHGEAADHTQKDPKGTEVNQLINEIGSKAAGDGLKQNSTLSSETQIPNL